jgi:threonine dehydratase
MKLPDNLPGKKEFTAAVERIRPYIHRTPVLSSQTINAMTGAELFFKCENFQKAGAFKFRGASNRVFSLAEKDAAKGVATHSSGNHAQALALAAKMRGIPAYIVMPGTSSQVKVAAVRNYDGQITFCPSTQKDREETCNRIIKKTGAYFIHPYNDMGIITGQGTCAMEILEEGIDPDVILPPVGGGGLLSGTALATACFSDHTEVWGAEPANADDARRSMISGVIEPSMNPDTIADGLLTSLGDLTFPIIMNHVRKILTCSEESIIKAMRLTWERMKIIVEPSGAVPLAVIFDHPEDFKGKRVAVIISGGNVDLNNLPW